MVKNEDLEKDLIIEKSETEKLKDLFNDQTEKLQ